MRIHHALVLALATLPVALVSLPVVAAHPEQDASADPVLAEVVAGDWRTPEARARDVARHPVESLTFWGLKPGMTILEIQPGSASWWTEILAPYAKRTGGEFYVTGADLANPQLPEAARKARADFEARYAAKPELYGKVGVVDWGANSAPLPADTFDLILTARSVHGWMGTPGVVEKTFKEFHDALKPGGILTIKTPYIAGLIQWANDARHDEMETALRWFGGNDYPQNCHKFVWPELALKKFLKKHGLDVLKSEYLEDTNIRLTCRKRGK